MLKIAHHYNEDPHRFAIPLDFTRFSCIGDLYLIDRTPKIGRSGFIEAKEGAVNNAMLDAIQSRKNAEWQAFFEKFGDKGIKQAERFFRQEKTYWERSAQIRAEPGVYRRERGTRIVVASKTPPKYFTSEIENLCERARQGKFAVEIFDECLAVAALDTTAHQKYLLAEFDARMLVLNAYIDPDKHGTPDDIVKQLDQIEFTNWLEGFGSIVFIPALIRPVSTRTFLDLMFGRIILLSYF